MLSAIKETKLEAPLRSTNTSFRENGSGIST